MGVGRSLGRRPHDSLSSYFNPLVFNTGCMAEYTGEGKGKGPADGCWAEFGPEAPVRPTTTRTSVSPSRPRLREHIKPKDCHSVNHWALQSFSERSIPSFWCYRNKSPNMFQLLINFMFCYCLFWNYFFPYNALPRYFCKSDVGPSENSKDHNKLFHVYSWA